MTSYQRRLVNIKYLEQCIKELEGINETLVKKIASTGAEFDVNLFPNGINGDDYITPFNDATGEYWLRLHGIYTEALTEDKV